jgi:hypothetical protein
MGFLFIARKRSPSGDFFLWGDFTLSLKSKELRDYLQGCPHGDKTEQSQIPCNLFLLIISLFRKKAVHLHCKNTEKQNTF